MFTISNLSTIVAACAILLLGGPALADSVPLMPDNQCDVTQNGSAKPNCNTLPPPQNLYLAVTTPAYQAVRSDSGSPSAPVDVWGKCRYITNNSGPSIFIPFNSALEWNDFRAAAKSGAPSSYISLQTCGDPWMPPVSDFPPDTKQRDTFYCGSPVLTRGPAPKLPYAPSGTIVPTLGTPYSTPETAQYQCTCPSNENWTETVTQAFIAKDADVDNPSWSPYKSPSYSGNGPKDCYGINGQCGPANGNSYTDAAQVNAAGLCSNGTAVPSSVSDPGPWNWACDGSNGGTNASCSASVAVALCGPPVTAICDHGTQQEEQACAENAYNAPLCLNSGKMSNYNQISDGNSITMSWTCTLAPEQANCARLIITSTD